MLSPGQQPTHSAASVIRSAFGSSPATRCSRPWKPGWRTRLPASSSRVSIRRSSRNSCSRRRRSAPPSRSVSGKPNQDGSAPGRLRGRTSRSANGRERRREVGGVLPPPAAEVLELGELGHAQRGLHVGDLEVEADVREDVLVVVAGGQLAEAALEAPAADPVDAGRAPAVPAPLAQRAERAEPHRVVARHRAALAGRHVVRGIERVRRRGAERPGLAAADARAERVAAVLDQHEPVLAAQRLHAGPVERVAERVREHERRACAARSPRRSPRATGCRCRARRRRRPARARAGRRGATVVGNPIAAVITSSPGRSGALVQVRRRRRDREQVRLRAGADEHGVLAVDGRGEAGAERVGEAALGQVGVQDRVGGRDEVRRRRAPSRRRGRATRRA